MTHPVERLEALPYATASGLLIRPAQMGDIEGMLALQAEAFEDKFRAAFGRRRLDRGMAALVRSQRMQGPSSLAGMYVAEDQGAVIGTITLRTSDSRGDDSGVVEQVLLRELGAWGTTRAIHAMSQLEHRIGRSEGYITDVAVAAEWRRQGVAGSMLATAAREARQANKTYLGLYVSSINAGAQALYYRFGFRAQHSQRSWWNWLMMRQSRWLYMTCHLE